MLFLRIFFVILPFFNLAWLSGHERPLSIVMIGGGPAGLGAAIEAKLGGAHVTIVEKREAYTREQYFFLWGASLSILKQLRL